MTISPFRASLSLAHRTTLNPKSSTLNPNLNPNQDNEYLAVSRSFGDVSLKTPKPLVVCTPEIKAFDITEV